MDDHHPISGTTTSIVTNITTSHNNSDIIGWNDVIASYEHHHEIQQKRSLNCLTKTDDDDEYSIPIMTLNSNCCLIVLVVSDDESHNTKKQKHILQEEPPSTHTYHVTIIAQLQEHCTGTQKGNATGYTFHFYSIVEHDMITPLSSVLRWFRSANSIFAIQDYYWDITITTFAKQPRQALPPIQWNESNTSESSSTGTAAVPNNNNNNIKTLRIQYFTINHLIIDWTNNVDTHDTIEKIELVQCTMNHPWDDLLFVPSSLSSHHDHNNNNNNVVPLENKSIRRALTMSCSLPEFTKFISAILQNIPHVSIVTELSLVLHFYIPDTTQIWKDFCTAIWNGCTNVTHLSIKYLDISDVGWEIFCTWLSKTNISPIHQLRYLSLGYTDTFVDNYRRLTTERRTKRTQQMLQFVESVPTLQYISFPDYQQDPIIMNQITAILEQRRQNVPSDE